MKRRHALTLAGAALIISLLAILYSARRGSDPFKRYDEFAKSHPVMRIGFVNRFGKDKSALGYVVIRRPIETLYNVKSGTESFSACNSSAGYVELDRTERTYDQSPSTPGVGVRGSRMSGAPASCPSLALYTDLAKGLPKQSTITPKLDGDEINAKASGPMGSTEFWVDVNGMGEITHYRVLSESRGQVSDTSWDLSYTFPSLGSNSAFNLKIPLGYVPYALSPEHYPLQKGKVAPTAGWKSEGRFANLLELSGHRPFLLSLLDSAQPSRSSIPVLARLRQRLPVFAVGAHSPVFPEISDPDGSRVAKLNPAGYPMFYLIDENGKVVHLWLGYDPTKVEEFENEVRKYAADPSTAPGSDQ